MTSKRLIVVFEKSGWAAASMKIWRILARAGRGQARPTTEHRTLALAKAIT
jgi:hypothetical protein